MAHGDKGWPITTWRRPIGEKVRGKMICFSSYSSDATSTHIF